MLRNLLRKWLLSNPPVDGKRPCGCGEHPEGHADLPHYSETVERDSDPAIGLPRQGTAWASKPDFSKGHQLRFEEKRTAVNGEWIILVWDGPSNYLLGAFIGHTYDEAREQTVEFAKKVRAEMKEKREALIHASYG